MILYCRTWKYPFLGYVEDASVDKHDRATDVNRAFSIGLNKNKTIK